MADRTKIEWTDATVNAVNGCSVLSPGCTHCYAMKLAGTRLRNHPSRAGLTVDSKVGPVWTGEVRLNEKALMEPLRWAKPRKIFWNAHGDLFHENVPDEWIDRCFAVMALTPQHIHQVLTKRADRMRMYMAGRARKLARFMVDEYLIRGTKDSKRTGRAINGAWPVQSVGDIDAPDDITMRQWPLPNVWLGVSVEDQVRADERVPQLLATPAAVRFLSCEPLLGPVNIEPWLSPDIACQSCDDGEGYGNRCSRNDIPRDEQCPWNRAVQIVRDHGPYAEDGEPTAVTCEVITLNWVIVGGESGPGARPMHPDWARSLRDQCAAAGVPFFFKQWGDWAPVCAMSEDVIESCYPRRRGEHDDRTRRPIKPQAILTSDGRSLDLFHPDAFRAGTRSMTVFRIGKKAAGRLLNGIEHNGMPVR